MNKLLAFSAIAISFLTASCQTNTTTTSKNEIVETEKSKTSLPSTIKIEGVAQNPEGIEYDKSDQTFLLSSLNAGSIIKVNSDGTYKSFTSGESYPMSTGGLQLDHKNNRLLVAACNLMELYDKDPTTKGSANLRIYNLKTGVMEKDINLSSLIPDATAYMANDVAVDNEGNVYVSDWYAGVIYKVNMNDEVSLFWKNETGLQGEPNGLDFHTDGYLLVSLISVNEQGLYADYGLVKIPTDNPESAKTVTISNAGYNGFDGMVINSNGNVVGVTNDGKTPGGNALIELSSKNNWESAEVINSKTITPSTTVAITPENKNYVINQDFMSNESKTWTIEQIEF